MLDNHGVLRLGDPICAPNVDGLRQTLLAEAYGSKYAVHPRSTKMYQDLRQLYW